MKLPRFRGHRDERGVALTETALIAPVVLAMLLVVFDFGRGFHAYIAVSNGARDAARVAMQTNTNAEIIEAGQKGALPYAVSVNPGNCGAGLREISVTFQYQTILPFVDQLWDGIISETTSTRAKCS